MRVWILCLLFAVAYAKHERYAGWRSYFVTLTTKRNCVDLNLIVQKFDLKLLSSFAVNHDAVVLVPPRHQEKFILALQDDGLSYRLHSSDVKAQLDIDDNLIDKRKFESLIRNGDRIPYDNYQELDVIYDYLDEIAVNYPHLVTLVTAGNSFEGRPIKYLKISDTKFEDESKPIIVIDGGIHGRDWISTSTVTYVIHKLIEDLTESDMLTDFDWIVLPVVNPDGYNYTFTADRFWSKTRSTDQHALSAECPGVNANKNFDFFWNTYGVSNNPCSDKYPGNKTFSEAETHVVRDLIEEHIVRVVLYVSMQSQGSLILYPWGHDGSFSNHAFALHSVGISIADAIYHKSLPNFPRYIVGNSVLVTGRRGSGSAVDYVHLRGVPLSYALQLPGLSEGSEGFHLDPKYIEQVGAETWAGLVVGVRRAGELFGDRKK